MSYKLQGFTHSKMKTNQKWVDRVYKQIKVQKRPHTCGDEEEEEKRNTY